MSLFACTLACLLFSMRYGHCNSKRMICEDIESEETDTRISAETSRCPPGPKGMKGDQGIPGVPGPPGKVENERLDGIIEATVTEKTQELKSTIDEMSAKIQNLTHKTPATCDGIVYHGRCFWAEIDPDRASTFYDALELCKKKNYELANIYTKGQYNAVMRYLESKMEQRTLIQLWTGMRKTYMKFAAQMTNGAQAQFTKPRDAVDQWHKADLSRTHVYIHLGAGESGMGAIWPSFSLDGTLCQYFF